MTKFKATLRLVAGSSYGVIIPKAYVENGLMKEGTEYEFEAKEVPA